MMRFPSDAGIGVRARQLLGIRLGCLRQHPPRPLSITSIANPGSDGNLPSISLVTPSFRQGDFIARTMESVLQQSYPGLQYVVQDGLSPDGTGDILVEYEDRGIDIRREADGGQADAVNRGFARSAGEIMAYLNSDDMLLPGALHGVGRYFRDHPDVDIVYGNRLIVDESDREIGRWILPGHDGAVLRFIDYVPQETLFWRRRIWDRVGAHFDTALQFAMDWDLLLRFQDAGAIMHHLPELIGVFRVHDAQKSQALYRERGAREMALLRVRYRAPSTIMRLAPHGQFLWRHRSADAVFASNLGSALNLPARSQGI